MVTLPKTADEWTLGIITDLLYEGYDESQHLEYKIAVNPEGDRIAKTACAFANTEGGFIIFGIDSDRKKDYHERIVGLENSDQIKRQIIDQINNIKPNIPLANIHFKKNNIPIQNTNVVIVLHILPSLYGPHQFNDKFYKRLSDGNQPMPVDEIFTKIIELRKNYTLFDLMLNELGIIRQNLQIVKNLLKENNINDAITQCELTTNDATHHFLYNQAYLYNADIQSLIYTIVTVTQRLSYDVGRIYDDLIDNKRTKKYKQFLNQNNAKSEEDYMKKFLNNIIDLALNNMLLLEKITKYKIPEPTSLLDSLSDKTIK